MALVATELPGWYETSVPMTRSFLPVRATGHRRLRRPGPPRAARFALHGLISYQRYGTRIRFIGPLVAVRASRPPGCPCSAAWRLLGRPAVRASRPAGCSAGRSAERPGWEE